MGHVFALAGLLLLLPALLLLPSDRDDAGPQAVPPTAGASAPVPGASGARRSARRPAQRAASAPQAAASTSSPAGEAVLAAKRLVVPVQGIPRSQLNDNFSDSRGTGRTHKALDIMAPWGTPVLAADDGRVAKISRNRGGGLALYQEDATGRIVYYYAHLSGYADGLREGQALRRGDVIGYVGTTGNAPDSAPHLHFAVQLLTVDGRWWKGEPVNPYAALVREESLTAQRSR
jgi:murein DD-endopeptidase MepM/ murein hydrolase activator NlpD